MLNSFTTRCATLAFTLTLALANSDTAYACRGRLFGGGGNYSAPMYYAPPMQYARPMPYSAPASYAAPSAAAPYYAPAAARAAAPVEITITNPEMDAITYRVDGTQYDMQPGYSQRLTTKASWIVEFDRGDGRKSMQYTLTAGSYRFVASERGWDLVRGSGESSASPPPPPAPAPGHPIARY